LSNHAPTDGNWSAIKKCYTIHEPYIVAFGGFSLHKNITRLIEAYAAIKNDFPHQLVLIGRIPANVNLEVEIKKWNINGRLVTTGYISDEDTISLLSHADLFVLPSLYEGFGLPVLEAQQAGVAVACSNAASLPEVGGEGAVYFNPKSVDDIMLAIKRCLADSTLRDQLIVQGKKNVARFNWKKTAQATLLVYHDVLQSRNRHSRDR
jgi:glycosyltransferase involved in cell wall biosynthesis